MRGNGACDNQRSATFAIASRFSDCLSSFVIRPSDFGFLPASVPVSGANCETPTACNFQSTFPLTPALSLRERENQGPGSDNSKRLGLWNVLPMMHPLPEGEGRGEGERSVRQPERCDFCNRFPDFGFLLPVFAFLFRFTLAFISED